MKCSSCGAEIKFGSSFCDNCGAVVTDKQAQRGLGIKHETFGSSSKEKISVNMNVIIIALIAVIAVLACVLISVVVINHSKKNSYDNEYHASGYENNVSKTAQNGSRTSTEDHNSITRDPVFTMATASSIRGTDTEGGQYSTLAVLNTDNETKWVPRKSNNGGISEWIQIYSDSTQYVRGVEILNGYHKSYEIWKNNNRVKSCTITFSNGESRSFVLDDTMDLIRLDLGDVVETTSIRLTINSIYSGIKWNDTAITYLGAY